MKNKILIISLLIFILIVLVVGLILLIQKNIENSEKYNIEIDSFSYYYGSYHGGYIQYGIYTEDDKAYMSAYGYNSLNVNFKKEIDKSVLNNISKIVAKNKIYKWNGFSKSDDDVLDGYSFTLIIKYVDGKEIRAYGYMEYPSNYNQWHKEITEYLKEIE